MAETKIIGYKKLFGLVLPDWVDEKMIKLFAFSLLSVTAMALVLIFMVQPKMNDIQTKKSELKSARLALDSLNNSRQGISRLQSDLGQAEITAVLSAIPRQFSPEGAIYMLRSISNDSGVTITSYSLPSGTLLDTSGVLAVPGTNPNDMVGFNTFPIRITVTAPVTALLNFIAKVESSLPFGVVSDLNLQEVTKLSKQVAGKSVQLSLEIAFYQSTLRTVNINKVLPFTPEDIATAKDLAKYNTFSTTSQPVNAGAVVAPGSGNVFGF